MGTNLYFGFIVYLFLGLLFAFLLFRIIIELKTSKLKSNLKNISTLILALVLTTALFYGAILELNFIINYEYVQGKIVGFCKTGKLHQLDGVEFEYYLDGQLYRKCNELTIDKSLIILGVTKVQVRTTSAFPDNGRIDFDR